MQKRLVSSTWFWTVAAASALAWGLLALLYASLGPAEYVPRILFSYHMEHFAAFYVVAVLAAAGLPRTRLLYVGLVLVSLAALLELVRTVIPPHQHSSAQDLVADTAGVLAALAPMFAGRFRRISAEDTKSAAPTP